MMVKIVPKDCQGEDAKFEGYVELMPLGFDESMEILVSSSVELSELKNQSQSNQLKILISMVKASKPKYQKVEIKRLVDGKVYKSVDDLWYDSSCKGILTDVASQLFGNESLGN